MIWKKRKYKEGDKRVRTRFAFLPTLIDTIEDENGLNHNIYIWLSKYSVLEEYKCISCYPCGSGYKYIWQVIWRKLLTDAT